MSNRDPSFDSYVLQIREVLDRLDYYRLLGIERQTQSADVKKAFYTIAAKFHPDRNRDAEPHVYQALYDIFKRLNEAYRVLLDSEQRAMYDNALKKGKARLDLDGRRTNLPQAPEDSIHSRDARQFFRQAEQAFKEENLLQADLHIKMAMSREPTSAAIRSLSAKIQAAKRKK